MHVGENIVHNTEEAVSFIFFASAPVIVPPPCGTGSDQDFQNHYTHILYVVHDITHAHLPGKTRPASHHGSSFVTTKTSSCSCVTDTIIGRLCCPWSRSMPIFNSSEIVQISIYSKSLCTPRTSRWKETTEASVNGLRVKPW